MDVERYMERVEQYTLGTMPPAERAAFEAELATNTELRDTLDLYRLGQEVIEQGVEASLRSKMQGWASAETAAPPMTASRVNLRPMWIRLAAAASVVLVLGWFSVQWSSRNYSDEALFAGQYATPEASTFRSGAAMENPLEPGFIALEDKQWKAAENFFKTVSPDQERYAEAQYYLGHAALQLGHYDLAKDAFQSCIRKNEVKFSEKAQWNLLLTYVAAGETDDADFRQLLDAIRNDQGHSYQREAQALYGKLGSFWRRIAE